MKIGAQNGRFDPQFSLLDVRLFDGVGEEVGAARFLGAPERRVFRGAGRKASEKQDPDEYPARTRPSTAPARYLAVRLAARVSSSPPSASKVRPFASSRNFSASRRSSSTFERSVRICCSGSASGASGWVASADGDCSGGYFAPRVSSYAGGKWCLLGCGGGPSRRRRGAFVTHGCSKNCLWITF